jgi:hypothetical protein
MIEDSHYSYAVLKDVTKFKESRGASLRLLSRPSAMAAGRRKSTLKCREMPSESSYISVPVVTNIDKENISLTPKPSHLSVPDAQTRV